MKKFLSLILALAMVACMSVTAFAADGSTVLTAEVPGFTYTLHVPATATIPYGATETDIGKVSVTVDPRFLSDSEIEINGVKKYITISESHAPLSNGTDSIPYTLSTAFSFMTFDATGDSNSRHPLEVEIDESAWNVSPGTYTSTITYTVEVK